MQEGDVGGSNSDLLTDKADEDETRMPDRCVKMERNLVTV